MPTDPAWNTAWLADLVDPPAGCVWPRLMTAPHPAAVGSYGDEVAAVDYPALAVAARMAPEAHPASARSSTTWTATCAGVRW